MGCGVERSSGGRRLEGEGREERDGWCVVCGVWCVVVVRGGEGRGRGRRRMRGGGRGRGRGVVGGAERGGNAFGWQATVPFHSVLTHSAVGISLGKIVQCSWSEPILLGYTHCVFLLSLQKLCVLFAHTDHVSLLSSSSVHPVTHYACRPPSAI